MTETLIVALTAWLTQIWDEEERLAKACIAEVGDHRTGDPFDDGSGTATYDAFPSYGSGSGERELAYMAGPGHPASVLARIAADRRILELHREVGFTVFTMRGVPEQRERYCEVCQRGDEDELVYPCQTLLLMASPYADREGFQEAWR